MGINKAKQMVNRQFKRLRAYSGITQKQIEHDTGIYASKISYFEQGFASPSPEEAQLLADALGCERREVLDCFGETKTP